MTAEPTPTNASSLLKAGTLFCVASAVAYTAYNVCLRWVSSQCDPTWINCVQSSVSVAVFGAYLLWLAARRRPALPPWIEVAALLTIGLMTQAGNILFIWSMSVVGVAVTATIQTGVMLAASAVLGLIVLGERVSWPQVAAIGLITFSVVSFGIGAQSAGEASADPLSSSVVLWGLAAAMLAGLAFAVLTVGVRKTVTGNTSPQAVVFLINLMGVVAMGPWCVHHLGLDTLRATDPRDLGVMLAAGGLNLIAFLLVTKSLQTISVVRFNVLNNGLTTALTAAIGIAVFAEAWNAPVLFGILLSLAGILVISQAAPETPATSVDLTPTDEAETCERRSS
jgi:drug/metabolite transporter (DMT)-like permease